ncbi:MAG: hypothetical protein SFU56_00830 [Capsulimonadales bacterium]|nr:hypothetical protein [Capsulimonadales bacterium]
MKKEIHPGVIIGAIVVILGVVGFFAFKTFFTDPNYTPLQGAEGQRKYIERRSKDAEIYKKIQQQQAAGVPPDQIKTD